MDQRPEPESFSPPTVLSKLISDALLRGLPLPVRLLALAGLLFVAGVFATVALAATASVAPNHEVRAVSHHQAVGNARRVSRRAHRPKRSAAPKHQAAAPAAPAPAPAPPPLLEAGFENGLVGWNTAGVGEETPTVVSDIVRTGAHSGRFVLNGSESRSELIFGGDGSIRLAGTVEFHEGDEYWYGFSFYIVRMVWGHPGAHNLIMQFPSGEGQGSPGFGLDLWDYGGQRGLWSEGASAGGNRFLAPLSEGTWYDVAIHFRASERGAGFYETFLDGQLVDSRQNTSMINPGRHSAYIKDGLYRNGAAIPGTSEIRLDNAKLGTSLASVSP
jgi:hypothetical protein